MNQKIVVYKDGSWIAVQESWEYEGDPDWLVTITAEDIKKYEDKCATSTCPVTPI